MTLAHVIQNKVYYKLGSSSLKSPTWVKKGDLVKSLLRGTISQVKDIIPTHNREIVLELDNMVRNMRLAPYFVKVENV